MCIQTLAASSREVHFIRRARHTTPYLCGAQPTTPDSPNRHALPRLGCGYLLVFVYWACQDERPGGKAQDGPPVPGQRKCAAAPSSPTPWRKDRKAALRCAPEPLQGVRTHAYASSRLGFHRRCHDCWFWLLG